jgi:hypothetical protein
MPAAQSARWCFTINNYTSAEYDLVCATESVYLVVGKEVGESNTPHLQGFVIFQARKRLSAVKALPGFSRAHLEVARGTSQQAKEYCLKEGDFIETGTCPATAGQAGGDAEKERWKRTRAAAVAGNMEEIEDDIFIRHYFGLRAIRKDYMVKPADLDGVCGVWIWGPPGVGKSHRARADYPNPYMKMQNKWWDGYQGEDNVLIDDVDDNKLGHHYKIWADKYSFLGESKGSSHHIRPKKIIITSNYSIDELWNADSIMAAAIKRRFEIIHMTEAWDTMQEIDRTAQADAMRFM